MLFEEMTWMDVEHYVRDHDDRVVLVAGACEQHAYLSLLSDVRAPVAIARAASNVERVPIAPPLPYGISPYFSAYPGTVTLSPETFTRVVREVIEGLLGSGFRGVLVSNGHGGNTAALTFLLIELGEKYPDARFGLFEWWKHPRVAAAADAAGLPQHHANWSEALPINRVGGLPDGDKEPPSLPGTLPPARVRAALGDGSYGGPYRAPEQVYDQLFDAAVMGMVEALRGLAKPAG